MRTLDDFTGWYKKELANEFPAQEIDTFLFLLLNKFSGFNRSDLLLRKNEMLDQSVCLRLEATLPRLLKHEPIQYILGETEFFGLTFKVNPYVLIPRPETEELVQWVLDKMRKEKLTKPVILDIGTGSGIIAVSLKKNIPEAEVWGLDVSQEILTVARTNAIENSVYVEYFQQDVLKQWELMLRPDVIVSNPPYVPVAEKESLPKNVLDHEPHLALFAEGPDPLIFYRVLAGMGRNFLSKNGFLFLEVHEDYSERVARMLASEGFSEIQQKKDLHGRDRMIRCRLIL